MNFMQIDLLVDKYTHVWSTKIQKRISENGIIDLVLQNLLYVPW